MIIESSRNGSIITGSRRLFARSHLDDDLGGVSNGRPRHRVRHQLHKVILRAGLNTKKPIYLQNCHSKCIDISGHGEPTLVKA